MQGLGIALLPDFSAQTALDRQQLTQLLPGWQPVDAFAERLWIVRPYAAQVPRAVSEFIWWLRAPFSDARREVK